jgi:VWFA-related protein
MVRAHAAIAVLGLALAAVLAPEVAPGTAAARQQQVPRFTEHVTVSRMLVDARVLDRHGEPIADLDASEFKAKIDGQAVRVESATWVGAGPEGQQPEEGTDLPWAAPEPPGRLIVFLFQKDLEPSRIVGLMRMLIQARHLLDTFSPNDRVAVLSFDTHLKFWSDFTNDRERLRAIFERGVLLEKPRLVKPGPFPSLARYLTQERGRRAYSMEEALMLIGEALEALPGAKSLVLIGHGFGTLSGGAVYFRSEYGRARLALQEARASVFCLDTTDADAHTLEAGLEMAAGDTGGFFARTHIFPDLAVARLAGALAGHYVLFLEVSDEVKPGDHEIAVTVTRPGADVMARGHFIRQ